MKLTKDQAKQINNLHIKASNLGRVYHAHTLIEEVLDIIGVKHERYNDEVKGHYYFWRICDDSLEGGAE